MNLEERFKKEIVPDLQEKLGVSNALAVPRPEKIVVNMGIGAAKDDEDLLEEAKRELTHITGQTPNIRRAKYSEAGWGITKGDPIGLAVTLRGSRMWSFLDKVVKAALPRVRDFQGVKRDAFDGHGNYSLGFRDHTVFPEMDADEVDRSKGMQVTIVTSTENDGEGYALLKALGFPFQKDEERD